MNRGFQAAAAQAQQPDRHFHGVPVLVKPLSERAAAEHAGYFDRGCVHPVRAFQQWARRAGIPVKVAGRQRLYDPRVLEAFLNREAWTKRHATVRAFPQNERVGGSRGHHASTVKAGRFGR